MKWTIDRNWLDFILFFACIVILNLLTGLIKINWDLTSDKRYTISSSTLDLVEEINEPLYIRILLEGSFPAGFKRLRNSTSDLVGKFKSENNFIEFDFENPSVGTVVQINERRGILAEDGILPMSLRVMEGNEMTSKQIYPYAIVQLGARKVIVNLLEEQQQGVNEEIVLNKAVSLLEYKFADAFQKLLNSKKSNIVFTSGNGELEEPQLAALNQDLRKYYNTGRIDLDSIYSINKDIDLVIVAKPTQPFSDKDKFKLDQYLMKGGEIIWLIDYLHVNLDSINANKYYVPYQIDLNLDDLFAKSGIRFQPDLVLDLKSSRIPQVIGMVGDRPQIELIQWPYHLLVDPASEHPLVKNINRMNFFFPNSIDTLRTNVPIRKEILLESSEYTRYQMTPIRLSFDILKFGFDPSKFNKAPKNLAVLVEGSFESIYKNRVAENMMDMLSQIGEDFRVKSPTTKQLFVSDGDFIKNLYDSNSSRISPIGYNKWEKTTYKGNKDFILNSIEYMLDKKGVLSTRSKEVTLRLLDVNKVRVEKTKWRLINIVLPIILMILFGLGYFYIRKSKYTVT